MTADEHAAQRDLVRMSELMQATRADRRDMPRRKPAIVVVPPHVFVIPVVTENERLL